MGHRAVGCGRLEDLGGTPRQSEEGKTQENLKGHQEDQREDRTDDGSQAAEGVKHRSR